MSSMLFRSVQPCKQLDEPAVTLMLVSYMLLVQVHTAVSMDLDGALLPVMHLLLAPHLLCGCGSFCGSLQLLLSLARSPLGLLQLGHQLVLLISHPNQLILGSPADTIACWAASRNAGTSRATSTRLASAALLEAARSPGMLGQSDLAACIMRPIQ